MDLRELTSLYKYNYWASGRLMSVVDTLSQEQFLRELGSSHRSIRGTLVHIMGAEWIWLSRWRGQSPKALLSEEDFPDAESLKRRWREVERQMLDFVWGLKEEDLRQRISYTTTEGAPYTSPLWQMMLHVVNHSTYHRGQVTSMLRQIGIEPKGTDLILYYRELAAE